MSASAQATPTTAVIDTAHPASNSIITGCDRHWPSPDERAPMTRRLEYLPSFAGDGGSETMKSDGIDEKDPHKINHTHPIREVEDMDTSAGKPRVNESFASSSRSPPSLRTTLRKYRDSSG